MWKEICLPQSFSYCMKFSWNTLKVLCIKVHELELLRSRFSASCVYILAYSLTVLIICMFRIADFLLSVIQQILRYPTHCAVKNSAYHFTIQFSTACSFTLHSEKRQLDLVLMFTMPDLCEQFPSADGFINNHVWIWTFASGCHCSLISV